MAWIFQGNPKKFDLDDYLARYPELISWRVPRYRAAGAVGDRAFIWRAGPEAGVVASGAIKETPTNATKVAHPEALGDDLWFADKPEDDEAKVGIALDSVRLSPAEGMLRRTVIKDDPLLQHGAVITMPRGTAFRLNDAERKRIEVLWSGLRGSEPEESETSASEGRLQVLAHRRRERSRFLIEGSSMSSAVFRAPCIARFAPCQNEAAIPQPLRQASSRFITSLRLRARPCLGGPRSRTSRLSARAVIARSTPPRTWTRTCGQSRRYRASNNPGRSPAAMDELERYASRDGKARCPAIRVESVPGATIKSMIDWSSCKAVERDPERVSGAWVFRGSRVPVAALFENLEDGVAVGGSVELFPGVILEQARSVLEHAARSALAAA